MPSGFALSPVPTITWRRADGKPIARKARRHKSNGILEIPNFQQEDAGQYECVAENSRGKNVARGQLTFYGKRVIPRRRPLCCKNLLGLNLVSWEAGIEAPWGRIVQNRTVRNPGLPLRLHSGGGWAWGQAGGTARRSWAGVSEDKHTHKWHVSSCHQASMANALLFLLLVHDVF